MRVIVTGGGTGGHIYPAIAIADEISRRYDNAEIMYIGTPNSLEERILKNHKYTFESIEVKGFQRKLSVENLKRVILSAKAIIKARKIIKKFKPDFVIGTGGYVTGPVVYAASKLNIDTFIHEQNAYPGITNKILAKSAKKVFLGFDIAKKYLKTSSEIIVVGNPVREDFIKPYSKELSKENINLDISKKFVLVSGGSSGSDIVNKNFDLIIDDLIKKDIGFIFATGKSYYKKYFEKNKENLKSNKFIIKEYIDDISEYMKASDICIISAGATTISEVNALGKASIIVPKSYSAENHQEINAENIEKNNAGICIRELDLNPDNLLENIIKLLSDDATLSDMEKNSKNLYKGNPVERIVDEISGI